MTLTINEKNIINTSSADNQKTEIGTELYNVQQIQAYEPILLSYAVTADASSGLSIDVPYDMTITDVWTVCTAANGSGTLTLRSATNAISSAITCAVDTTLSRTSSLDDAYTAITTATSLNVISNGAGDRGIIYIMGIRS
jgi:predicted metalloprotease with PDZ domain